MDFLDRIVDAIQTLIDDLGRWMLAIIITLVVGALFYIVYGLGLLGLGR